jgi:hypothetical protein
MEINLCEPNGFAFSVTPSCLPCALVTRPAGSRTEVLGSHNLSASNFFSLFFWDRISLCSQGWPGTHCSPDWPWTQLRTLLPQSSECWDYRYVSPRSLSTSIFFFFFGGAGDGTQDLGRGRQAFYPRARSPAQTVLLLFFYNTLGCQCLAVHTAWRPCQCEWKVIKPWGQSVFKIPKNNVPPPSRENK